MINGFPECVPNNQTRNCWNTPCPPGTNCTMMGGYPQCVPNNQTQNCWTTQCPPGTNCTCPPGTNCTMINGFPECVGRIPSVCSKQPDSELLDHRPPSAHQEPTAP
eukprot:TRINITY_DN307_c0_g1_i9.p1 TRINITY_DN307_c0_g1~~TRINITY_DN307_c0_g1_i9.p1  ORF type:complete len:106 (+),score=22.05 TRINITY_DN307_c0_g1_i9:1-318(+)